MTADRPPGAPERGGVLVTGASSGIGTACARHLDTLGIAVWAGVRRAEDGERLRRETSPRLVPLVLDVTDAGSIEQAARAVAAATGEGGLAGLVNNAGIALGGPIELLPIEDLRRQLEVNVVGVVAMTQAFLPLVRRARGRIVNMGSVSGRMAVPLLGAYAASKFALEALSDALRLELRPWGIHVALIEPGAIATPIWEKSEAAAAALRRAAPAATLALYEQAIAAMTRASRRAAAGAIAPGAVARAVAHALTSPRPRARYLVGRDARRQAALATVLPDRLRDALLARALGLPRRAG